MSTPLLTTKLYTPPVRPELVLRPRLTERLNAGRRGKVTLISAPAGFGKTTLLSEWIAGNEWAVAWLSLDERDNDLTRFLTYFITAVQTIATNVGENALVALQAAQHPQPEFLMTTLINEIAACPTKLTLVLDDYHAINTESIHFCLNFLLDHLPPQLHLIIATRREPPLRLSRLRARGQMSELRADDLRFSASEAALFLNEGMRLNVSAQNVNVLEARTEGWITGLQLAALSMQGRHAPHVTDFINRFTGRHHYILDYLTDEVLSQQQAEIKSFLLQTCILNRLSGPLCDALTKQGAKNSDAILSSLEAANLFVVRLDDERCWYRYHNLFGELLRHKLSQLMAVPDVKRLHQRACDWYDQNGFTEEALRHALAAEDFERAAHLVEQNSWSKLMRGEVRTLKGWLKLLPTGLIARRARLCISYAWTSLIGFQLNEIEAYLQDAEQVLSGQPTPDSEIRGEIDTIRAILARIRGDVSHATRLHHQTLEHIKEDNLAIRGMIALDLGRAYLQRDELQVASQSLTTAIRINQSNGNRVATLQAISVLGGVQVAQGKLHQAAQTYEQALQMAAGKDSPSTSSVGMAYAGLANVQHEWNQLNTATQYALKAIELGKLGGMAGSLVHGQIILAQIKQTEGDILGAFETLQETEQIMRRSQTPQWTRAVVAHQARLWLRRYRLEQDQQALAKSIGWAQDSGLLEDWQQSGTTFNLLTRDFEHLTLARLFIAQGELDNALELLAWLLEGAEAAGRIRSVIEIFALQALTWQAKGKRKQAISPLTQACELAQPEEYVNLFVDEGAPMALLLADLKIKTKTKALHASNVGAHNAYMNQLLQAFPASQRPTAAPTATFPFIDPLSQRELEVLRLMAADYSNRQIAEELTLAVGTVKRHASTIYSKLHVRNRTQAVIRGRELALI